MKKLIIMLALMVPVATFALEVRISAQATVLDGNRMVIAGETNLPDATQLMLSIENPSSSYAASLDATVSAGKFSTEIFSPDGGMPVGHYVAEINLYSLEFVQPDNVKAALGAAGEKMTGPLVASNDGEKDIVYKIPFAVGSKQQAADADKTSRQQQMSLANEIRQLIEAGRGMEKFRHGNDGASCGTAMRKYQVMAQELKGRAFETNNFSLRLASTSLWSCVYCAADALTWCDKAEQELAR